MNRLKNPNPDYQTEKCGHNFIPESCPYEYCGYRDTLKVLKDLTDTLASQKSSSLEVKDMVRMFEYEVIYLGLSDYQVQGVLEQELDSLGAEGYQITHGSGPNRLILVKETFRQ